MAAPTSDIGRSDLAWGSWGQGLLTEWFETAPDLIWPQSVVTYGRMRHDPQIKAVLGGYFRPILRATWVLDPTGCRTQVVQHVADDLGMGILGQDNEPGPARRRGVSWDRHLREAVNYLIFGHMPFERRYEIDSPGPGGTHLANLGSRMPWTIAQMKIDGEGQLEFIEQTTQRDPIPGERLVWYVNDQEGSNWAGISMLRAAFGIWLLKNEVMRVHATSIRRFGMGVPTVEAPPGASQAQVLQAQMLASAMRSGDQAGMGLPQGFKPSLMGMTGSAPDALAFIKYCDVEMAKMVHAGLIELGQTDNGSRALGETFMDLFQLALQSVADEIASTATSGHPGMPGIVTDLVDQNWGEDEPAPRIVCTDVGQNYETSANAIQSLVMSGAMTPDPALDEWVRKTWRLPKRTDKWTPSSRGIPAGDATNQKTENALGNTGVPGKGGAPAQPAAPQPATTPAASYAQPGAAHDAVLASRVQQDYIRASTWEPTQHQDDWEQALASLLLQYRSILSANRTDLVDRALAAMKAGREQDLVLAAPGVGHGPDLVKQAMVGVARRAAQALVDEALRQGVVIDLDRVKIDAEAMGGTARARALYYSGWMAQQATAKALQVYGPSPKGFIAAADEIDKFLGSLSTQALKDQFGAALTAAQNRGRLAVLEAAPESAGTAHYVAAEFLDKNTCDNCRRIDGEPFDTLEAAEEAYPTGGYHDCLGLMRCRGTVVAVWGGNDPESDRGTGFLNGPRELPTLDLAAGGADPKVPGHSTGGLTGKFDPLEKRGHHGEWEHGDGPRNPETGRLAAQTPSQFTHPATGHKMGKTEIGDTFESLFEAKGAHLLEGRFGGPYTLISGGGGPRNTPLDFRLDHSHAGELKTLNAGAANQKTAIKRDEVMRKQAAAKDGGMKPLLVVQVVDTSKGKVEVYAYPEFASKTTKAMEHLGGYTFGPADFKAAQEATGHWAQRTKRAADQGIR